MIELFRPEVSETAWSRVAHVLGSKYIGQGPVSDEFEAKFQEKFHPDRHCVAVSSGTAALTLAYILAGVKAGSRVITPTFTCTATNLPILHLGGKIAFADLDPETMNVSPDSVYRLLAKPASAIVAVNYAGALADTKRLREMARGIPVIEDAAQSIGHPDVGRYSDYVAYSFQAIKTLTTVDGGLLVCKTAVEANIAKRLRWFGIARKEKLENRWAGDISELGYKFQLTDVNAAVGLANMETFDERLEYRRKLLSLYRALLKDSPAKVVGASQIDAGTHAAWICTVVVDDAGKLQSRLAAHGIESNATHYVNHKYSVFKPAECDTLKNAESMEGKYLLLPLHAGVCAFDVERICEIISPAISS